MSTELVSVPRGLLLEVLETAEVDSSAVESEHACNAGDRAAYEAEREKISELRRHATTDHAATRRALLVGLFVGILIGFLAGLVMA